MCEGGKTADIKDLRRDEGRKTERKEMGTNWEGGGFIFETMKNS